MSDSNTVSPAFRGSARAARCSPKPVFVASAISEGSALMSWAMPSRAAARPANNSRSGSRCGAVRFDVNSSRARLVRSGMGPIEALFRYVVSAVHGNSDVRSALNVSRSARTCVG